MNVQKIDKAVTWAAKGLNENRGWIAEDYLSVFRDFFEAYNLFEDREHPDISYFAMLRLMERMPWADTGEKVPLEPSEYTGLIGAYFCDSGPERDHSIHDFLSGEVLEKLYFEQKNRA